jgi:hypothetical protein
MLEDDILKLWREYAEGLREESKRMIGYLDRTCNNEEFRKFKNILKKNGYSITNDGKIMKQGE